MPRLLQKLRRVANAADRAGAAAISLPEGLARKRKRIQTLNRPLPTQPQLTGRAKSILLDDIKLMKGERSNKFIYHKKQPPQVRIMNNQKNSLLEEDAPREMTEEERSWYSSPWRQSVQLTKPCSCIYQFVVRMLSSPMRQCVFTGKYLPAGESMHYTKANPYELVQTSL